MDIYGDSSQASFTDLEAGAWYVDDVQFAAQLGLVKGDHEGKFNPNSNITRQEIATIMGNAYTFVTDQEISANADQVLSSFADPNAVSPWAKDSVAFLVERNVINGVDGNRIDPTGLASRAMTAVMINRILNVFYYIH